MSGIDPDRRQTERSAFVPKPSRGRTGFETDTRGQLRRAGAGILAVELCERALDRQRGADRALDVVLMGERIAEQCKQPVAQLLGDVTSHFRDRGRSGVKVRPDEIAPLLGIELRGNPGRTHQVAKHHREVAALTGGVGCGGTWWRRGAGSR